MTTSRIRTSHNPRPALEHTIQRPPSRHPHLSVHNRVKHHPRNLLEPLRLNPSINPLLRLSLGPIRPSPFLPIVPRHDRPRQVLQNQIQKLRHRFLNLVPYIKLLVRTQSPLRHLLRRLNPIPLFSRHFALGMPKLHLPDTVIRLRFIPRIPLSNPLREHRVGNRVRRLLVRRQPLRNRQLLHRHRPRNQRRQLPLQRLLALPYISLIHHRIHHNLLRILHTRGIITPLQHNPPYSSVSISPHPSRTCFPPTSSY